MKIFEGGLEFLSDKDKKIFKQIRWSLVFKAFAFIAYYYSVSIQLDILGAEAYGVWATLLSVVTWMAFFDFGVGNGIKNYLTAAFSTGDSQRARQIITTSYVVVFFISIFVFLLISMMAYGFDMRHLFNTTVLTEVKLKSLVVVLFLFVSINFVLAFVRQFIFAVQKNSLNELEQLTFYLLLITGLLLLHRVEGDNKLIYIAVIYGLVLILSKVLLSGYFFLKYPDLKPLGDSFKFELIRPLAANSAAFFLLQLISLSILLTDRLIIIQLLGPLYVTEYDLVYRVFSAFLVLHGIVNAPMWSAYTEAYAKKELEWIKVNLRRMNLFVLIMIPMLLFLVLNYKYVLGLWLGEDLSVSSGVVLAMAVLVIVMAFANNYAFLLNATNKISFQLGMLLIGALVKIPIALILIRYTSMKGEAVIWGAVAALSVFTLSAPFYVRAKLLK